MKNIIKKNYKFLLGILIGAIITATSAYAVTSIASSSVAYNNTTSGLSSTNVKDALDEIYSIQNSGNAKASDILAGKKAFSGGKLITGTYTTPAKTLHLTIGSNHGSANMLQTRMYLSEFSGIYKYFKITVASAITSACTGIYFSSKYDSTDANIGANIQYSTATNGNFVIYTSGANGYFYDVQIVLYN